MEKSIGETPNALSGPQRARLARLELVRKLRDQILEEYPELPKVEDAFKKRQIKWEIQGRLKTRIMEELGFADRTAKEYLELVYP